MTPFRQLENQKELSPLPGFVAKMIHGTSMTTAFWNIESGSVLPVHSHVNEQISIVTKGCLQLTIGEETQEVKNGMVVVIPPNVPHSAVALEPTTVIDIFCPVREDYKL